MSKKKNKWMTPSEFGFRLNLANHTARNETADLERVRCVQTPSVALRPITPSLHQILKWAKNVVIRALSR